MTDSREAALAIVIPSYNEAGNIEGFLRHLSHAHPAAFIYVVDDGSPDGTAGLVLGFAQAHPKVQLIERPGKGGRGSAVAVGFMEALKRPELLYFMEMDADASHDPEDVQRLLDRIAEADVVIGSRYLRESKIVGWPASRHVFSRLANLYARVMLGVPISDYTNGFRLFRRTALEMVGLDRLREKGYIVLSEMAYKLHWRGCTFVDVPTTFVNRSIGQSNTTLREIASSFGGILRIRRSGIC